MSEDAKKETQRAVAATLKITTESLRLYRKLRGAPAGWNVEEWRTFIEQRGLAKASSDVLSELKVLIAQEELKKKQRENAVAEGKIIEQETVADFLREWTAKLDLMLTSELEVNAPPLLSGKSIVEVREEMKAIHDRIREATKTGLLKWQPAAA
jgi:hypothetical protein